MSKKGAGIDWDDVKRRLHASQLALDEASTPSPERMDATYRERAEQLARRRVRVDRSTTALHILVFTLGKDRYGLDFSAVVEMFPFTSCTPVPGGPPQLLGVINVHGEIRSVADLGRMLDLVEEDERPPGYVLLVRGGGHEIGLRVDGIDKIESVAPEDLAVPAGDANRSALPYLRGLAPNKLRILNTEAVFLHPIFMLEPG